MRWMMTVAAILALTSSALATTLGPPPADEPTEFERRFVAHVASLAEQADEAQRQVVPGEDGWLFFTPELRHLGAGVFWGERAAEVSQAPNPDWADPLPAIVDFHEQAERAGVQLIFVPVPAKATVYPDMLPQTPVAGDPARLDRAHRAFLDTLRERGVTVVDLTDVYLEHRAATDDERLYCWQDTHFSPR